jgi:DUF4097 and DUF4098 domain-containing protein YvlB
VLKEKAMKRAALVLVAMLALPGWVAAENTVDQTRPAAPDAAVSVENMTGSVTVTGWDRAEVQVKGTLHPDATLDFSGTEKRIHVEVESDRHPMGAKSDIQVFVPKGADVKVEGFQATIAVSGVTGGVEAETVNGSITQSGAAREVNLQSVNGSVESEKPSGRIRVEAVNGTVTIRDASGEVEASTVNGKLVVSGGSFSRVKLEGVSGPVRFEAGLSRQATLDVQTVSGVVDLLLPAGIAADFNVSTFSGEITNELGPAAVKTSRWTPEKELTFSTGAGGVRISVQTLSGAVNIRKRM